MKALTYEEWQKNPTPREMWVWDDFFEDKKKATVICVLKDVFSFSVMTVNEDYTDYCTYKHCAEIEIEELKKRRMTNQELYRWLLDGIRKGKRRELTYPVFAFIHSLTKEYSEDEANLPVDDDILIRENGGEWHEPLVEVEDD